MTRSHFSSLISLTSLFFSVGCAPAYHFDPPPPSLYWSGAEVRVRAGDSIVEGRLNGGRDSVLAVRLRDGRTIETSGYDSVWLRLDPVHPLWAALTGALVVAGVSQIASNASSGDDIDWRPMAALGALAGVTMSRTTGRHWSVVVPGEWGQRPPGPSVLTDRAVPADARRQALAAIPANARVRIAGPFGTAEGRFVGVWSDSVKLWRNGERSFAADSIRTLWTYDETAGPAIGGLLGVLAGFVGGVIVGVIIVGQDNPENNFEATATLVGFTVGGGFLGHGLGKLTEGWRQRIP